LAATAGKQTNTSVRIDIAIISLTKVEKFRNLAENYLFPKNLE